MNKYLKILIVIILVIAVSTIISWKQNSSSYNENQTSEVATETGNNILLASIPRLLELGSDKCTPCKAMEPILDELRKEYKNKFKVEFIDVWKNTQVTVKHNINIIPTQIFFDAAGKEVFRHEDFLSKQAILEQWRLMGITFEDSK